MFTWRKQVKAIQTLKTDPDLASTKYSMLLNAICDARGRLCTCKQVVCPCAAARCKVILCRSLVSAESHRKRNHWSFCQCVAPKKRAQRENKHETKGEIMSHKRSIISPFGIWSAIKSKTSKYTPLDSDELLKESMNKVNENMAWWRCVSLWRDTVHV